MSHEELLDYFHTYYNVIMTTARARRQWRRSQGAKGAIDPAIKKYRGESIFLPPQVLALVCGQNPEQPSTHKDAKPIDVGTML